MPAVFYRKEKCCYTAVMCQSGVVHGRELAVAVQLTGLGTRTRS